MDQGDFSWAEVGQRVREWRKEEGLTQKQLATAAELTPAGVFRVEAGDTNPSIDTLSKIAIALRTTVRELLQGRLPDHGIKHQEIFKRVERIVVSENRRAITRLVNGIVAAQRILDRETYDMGSPELQRVFSRRTVHPKSRKKK